MLYSLNFESDILAATNYFIVQKKEALPIFWDSLFLFWLLIKSCYRL